MGCPSDRSDDVEVGQGWLDHQHVRALVLVHFGFHDGFPHGCAGVHLVAAPVPLLRRRSRRVTEGPIEGRSEFHRVRKDACLVVSSVFKGLSNGSDSAVHHVGSTDVIGTGLGRDHSHLGEGRDGAIVDDGPVMDVTAVAVVGHRAHAHVGHQHHRVAVVFSKRPQGPHHGPVVVQAEGARCVFFRLGVDGEEHVALQAHGHVLRHAFTKHVHGLSMDAGKARDRFVHTIAFNHEMRLDKARGHALPVEQFPPPLSPSVDAHPYVHVGPSLCSFHQDRRASALGPCKRCTAACWKAG